MRVVAWSRSLNGERAEELGVELMANPMELARESDVVSIHVAASAETDNLVNKEFLSVLKPGSILVNTSRGSVVDEEALAEAVKQRGLRVCLDVYRNEPSGGTAKFSPAIMSLPGVYGTHHVAASTDQAQRAIAFETVHIAQHFRQTGEVRNCVNLATDSSATCVLLVRHRNRPGVLARVFRGLSEASINVLEMENLLYEGLDAACARIQLSEVPTDRLLDELRTSCSDILDIDLNRMPEIGDNR
jgi:D-3-phosphoglycerate dehydrogenase